MLSLTPLSPTDQHRRSLGTELRLALGRAEQESIAVIRATDDRAAISHCTMAAHYSAKAVAILNALESDREEVAPAAWQPRLVSAA